MKYLVLAGVLALMIVAIAEVPAAQRSAFLVAKHDVSVVDSMRTMKAVGTFKQGQKARVLRCEDTKHYIRPVIALDDGTVGVVADDGFEIMVKPTGPLSWPQFLGCGL